MKTTEQAFLKSIDLFKKMCIRTLELEYDEQKKDVENNKRIDDLHSKLMTRLNEDTKTMLLSMLTDLWRSITMTEAISMTKGSQTVIVF